MINYFRKKKNLPKFLLIISMVAIFVLIIVIIFYWMGVYRKQIIQTQALFTSYDISELEKEILRQEALQIYQQNRREQSALHVIASNAGIITTMVAVAGVFITIWKQISEHKRDREQRNLDSKRRLDEKFSSIVADVGSENPSIQLSAAVSLITFLRPEYAEFHEQVYLILLANLKIKTSQQVSRLLIQTFEKAVEEKILKTRELDVPIELDFTNTNLYRINLSNLDLRGADMSFADFRHANLKCTDLSRAKGMETNFEKASLSRANLKEVRFAKANLSCAQLHEATLVSANLKETNLNKAQLFMAKLQSAHLEKADISGAHFEQADLNDTFFNGAILDQESLKSIIKAFNWDKAHFDDGIRKELEALGGKIKI